MPYDRNADLPAAVRDAYSSDCQTVFREAFNGATGDEASKFSIAHSAAKNCMGVAKREAFAVPARIVKSDAVRQIAYGVVLEPRTADNPDAQGDFYTAEDVELAAHGFLEAVAKGEGGADLMHADDGEGPLVGFPVESYIAPVDFTWGSGDRLELVKAGSWVMGVHYPDPAIWDQVVKGELGAFSVWGSGMRVF